MNRRERRAQASRTRGQRIECEKHGRVKWTGDIVCARCGRVYLHVGDGFPDVAEDGRCECGENLFPTESNPKDFSARVCCHSCAVKTKAKEAQA